MLYAAPLPTVPPEPTAWWVWAVCVACVAAGLAYAYICARAETRRAAEYLDAEVARQLTEEEAWRQVLAGYPPRVRQILVERGKPPERPRRTIRERER